MAIACDPGVAILIVLNKDDLPEVAAARAALADHTALGWPILTTSASTGAGVEALSAALGDGISVLVGHSGVGKSTLVNRLVPAARLLTGDVHDATGKGRHTTSVTTVHVLNRRALVVDTPGVRAFPLDGMALARIAERFPGLGAVGACCHFAGCLHEGEPGCAVADAVAAGTLPAVRVLRWHQLLAALREEDAAAPARTRRARQSGGTAGGGGKGPPPRQRR
jgi:ribosome biogenesis GTPase